MPQPQSLLFEDAESTTRRDVLNVVHARGVSVGAFQTGYFAGYTSMRALTYSTSIPMIAGLLAEQEFESFECVFGHGGILSREAEDVLSFQNVMREKLSQGILALKDATDAHAAVYRRIADGEVRFYVVKDAIAHAKIYLLESASARRVIVGSANLSERAFSGRQAETLIVFDDDDVAWQHYSAQYQAVLDASTSRLSLAPEPLPTETVRIEETPILVEAQERPEGTTLFVPSETVEEERFSVPAVAARMEAVKPLLRRSLAGVRPARDGRLALTPRIVREMVRIVRSREQEAVPPVYLSRAGGKFTLSDGELRLDVDVANCLMLNIMNCKV